MKTEKHNRTIHTNDLFQTIYNSEWRLKISETGPQIFHVCKFVHSRRSWSVGTMEFKRGTARESLTYKMITETNTITHNVRWIRKNGKKLQHQWDHWGGCIDYISDRLSNKLLSHLNGLLDHALQTHYTRWTWWSGLQLITKTFPACPGTSETVERTDACRVRASTRNICTFTYHNSESTPTIFEWHLRRL